MCHLGGAAVPDFFEMAGEVGLLFVAQIRGAFLDAGAVAQQGNRLVLALPGQPDLGRPAKVLEKVTAQSVPGNTALFCQPAA